MRVSKLRTTRVTLGLTQVALAQLVGVSHQAISLIEGGYMKPAPSLRRRIARALCVHENELWPNN